MAIVKKYHVRVIAIYNQINGIYTLEMESIDRQFRYYPGQFLHLALDVEYDGIGQWPLSRCFSMQSNPDEDNIRITYAVKGSFTRLMEQQLMVGSMIWIKLPYGDLFSRYHNKEKAVFISGGTGITPFLSLFTHKSFSDYVKPHIYLGFRSKGYNIYEKEITNSSNPTKIVKYYYENIDGRLDIQNILNENGTSSDFFISGPPEMIKSFKEYLICGGVAPEQVKTDDWE